MHCVIRRVGRGAWEDAYRLRVEISSVLDEYVIPLSVSC